MVALKLEILPRTIPPEKRTALTNCLSRCPKGRVFILAGVFDPEATAYAAQIENVLTNSGFEAIRPVGFGPESILSSSEFGLTMSVKDLWNAPIHAKAIHRCFMDCGISMSVKSQGDTYFGTNRVEIIVGQHH
jgi:hypothetical protein